VRCGQAVLGSPHALLAPVGWKRSRVPHHRHESGRPECPQPVLQASVEVRRASRGSPARPPAHARHPASRAPRSPEVGPASFAASGARQHDRDSRSLLAPDGRHGKARRRRRSVDSRSGLSAVPGRARRCSCTTAARRPRSVRRRRRGRGESGSAHNAPPCGPSRGYGPRPARRRRARPSR
jgi:hypothetical protein